MQIPKPEKKIYKQEILQQDLNRLVSQPQPHEQPPCPYCKEHKPGSCSAECPDISSACSIDPAQYPIEPAVLPIVYGLNALRLIQTCWSCEGHMGHDGKLWKLPQVSFYSASPVYAMLISTHLDRLINEKQLAYRWHLVMKSYQANEVPTYVLEPSLQMETEVHLGKLQRDLYIIGNNLNHHIRHAAKSLLLG